MKTKEDYNKFLSDVRNASGIESLTSDDLLAGGLFGKETAGGYFALEPDTETVVYNYFFDFEKAAADVEAFIDTLEKILQLCDIWAERIKGGHAVDAVRPSGDSPVDHRIFA